MEDLFAKMQEILSSPEGQEQLKSVASMLGGTEGDASGNMPDLSQLASLLGNAGGTGKQATTQKEPESKTEPGGFDFSKLDMGMLLQVQKVFSSMNNEDDNTRLLHALKPHFSDKRKEKIDQAVKMMHLLELLPMLKESGILGGLFGDGGK